MIITSVPETKRGTTYDISRDGVVTNMKTGKVLKQHINKSNGYLQVALVRPTDQYYVHKLVAEAFIPNPNGYTEVNHKNEDKLDNRVENLEWCTKGYNQRYSLSKPVVCVETRELFPSIGVAAKKRGASQGGISAIISNIPKYKRSGGFHWRKPTEEELNAIPDLKKFVVGEEPIIIERRK